MGRWVDARSFPVRDSKGKFIRLVGIAEDVRLGRVSQEEAISMTPSTAFGRTAVSMRVRQTEMRHRLTYTGPHTQATFTIAQRRSRGGFGFDYGQG